MNKNRLLRYLLFLALALVFAACNTAAEDSGEGEPLPGGDNELVGTNWTLVSYGPSGAETPVLDGTTVTLGFESAAQLGGSGGCNSYGAEYTATNGSLSVGDIASTLMACVEEGVTEQEQDYLTALSGANEYQIEGDQLIIWYDNGGGVMTFTAS